MKTKICTRCKKKKSITSFAKMKRNKDGLQSRCKACQKILSDDHYLHHKDDYNNSRDRCRAKNPTRAWCSSSISHHKKRDFILIITLDELYELALQSTHCKYCGKELHYTTKIRGVSCHDSPTLDRLNNELEMRIDNVQIICRDCNTTKGSKPHNEFIEYCKMISNKFLSMEQ